MLDSFKKLNFDYIVGKVRQITREYPVEILTCLTAYILLVFFEGTMSYNLQLMPLVFGAAYAVNNFARSIRLRTLAFSDVSRSVRPRKQRRRRVADVHKGDKGGNYSTCRIFGTDSCRYSGILFHKIYLRNRRRRPTA